MSGIIYPPDKAGMLPDPEAIGEAVKAPGPALAVRRDRNRVSELAPQPLDRLPINFRIFCRDRFVERAAKRSVAWRGRPSVANREVR